MKKKKKVNEEKETIRIDICCGVVVVAIMMEVVEVFCRWHGDTITYGCCECETILTSARPQQIEWNAQENGGLTKYQRCLVPIHKMWCIGTKNNKM